MTEKLVLLYDGDLLVYRAGFAAEKRIYTVLGGPKGVAFSSAKQVKEYCKHEGIDPKNITYTRDPEPVENAIANVDKLMNSVRRDLSHRYMVDRDDVTSIVFLTGCGDKSNFRENIAHTYKANRAPEAKPTHYQDLRVHLTSNYATVITQGAETDDYLCQAARDVEAKDPDTEAIIVTIDKDLLSVPGKHYNFVTKTLLEIDIATANYNFFCQTLIGDRADNIEGVRGLGPAKAEKLLAPLKFSAEKMAITCLLQYNKQWGAGYLDKWNTNCQLLWIWREIPDMCPYLFSSEAEVKEFINFYGT